MVPKKAAKKVADETNITGESNNPVASTSKSTINDNQFTNYRINLRNSLADLVKVLRDRRANDNGSNDDHESIDPLDEDYVEEQVELIISKSNSNSLNVDNEGVEEEVYKSLVKKGSVDRALEQMLFDVVLHPQDPDTQMDNYGLITDLMDVVLTFAEKDYADANIPLQSLSGVLDLQTIAGCHHIFDYIESRRDRLTKNMNPQQGKGPLLLRLLNELLRRLPKSKTADVIFSGRILMFLSSVFPLAEKSGVNLRGNFNIGKETLYEDMSKVEAEEKKDDEMEVDGVKKIEGDGTGAQTKEFYTTFWSLQKYFNNPPVLFVSPLPPNDDPYKLLQHALTKTLDAFTDATAKEKKLLGAGAGNGISSLKKVDADISLADEKAVKEHYFFPKFLTSPNLLELEIADSSFRRQILVQMMVLFQFLLSFTPESRARDLAILKNPPAMLNHVLLPANEKWIKELKARALKEMESMVVGKPFSATVELILQREQNWINWKLKQCLPYEKPPLDTVSKSKLARGKLINVTRKPKTFPYALGNSTLSNLWRKNTKSLDGFEVEPSKESFDQLFRDWRKSKKLVDQKTVLLKSLEAEQKPDVMRITSLKDELEEGEKKTKALHWRAIRIASTTHLHLFSAIKDGNLELLVAAMDKEMNDKEAVEALALEPPTPIKLEETIEDDSGELSSGTTVNKMEDEDEEEEIVRAVLVTNDQQSQLEVLPSQVTTRDGDGDLDTQITFNTTITTSEMKNESDIEVIRIDASDVNNLEEDLSKFTTPGTPKRLREAGGLDIELSEVDEDEQVAKRLKLDEDVEMAELLVPKLS